MATNRPFKQCKRIGCRNLTKATYCDEHKKEKLTYDNRLSASKRGYDYTWQKYRKSFLAEHPLCVNCLSGNHLVPAQVVDHIIDHKGDRNLFWDRENHQALCKHCHDVKTGKTSGKGAGRG